MKQNFYLSIIVPAYNVGKFLAECLDSISRQTFRDIQIILVDDGSTDESGILCDAYKKKDPQAVVIHKENGGLVSARKAGVCAAKGRYITFVDGDDWVDADAYEALVSFALKNGEPDMLAFGCMEEYRDHRTINYNNVPEGLYTKANLQLLQRKILMGDDFFSWRILPHLCDKLIKKELLQNCIKYVPNEVSFGEDAVCTFLCIREADSVLSVNYAPYHYRQREGSIVRQNNELKKENFIGIYSALNVGLKSDLWMQSQLKYYMFFLLLLKAYSKIESNMPLFPFEQVKENSRLLIYGAGGFGKVLEAFVKQSKHLELAGWTDQNDVYYREQGYSVVPCDKLLEFEYDYLVIAILNQKTAEQIKNNFTEFGIEENKIDYVKKKVLEKIDLPHWLDDFHQ